MTRTTRGELDRFLVQLEREGRELGLDVYAAAGFVDPMGEARRRRQPPALPRPTPPRPAASPPPPIAPPRPTPSAEPILTAADKVVAKAQGVSERDFLRVRMLERLEALEGEAAGRRMLKRTFGQEV